MSGQRELTRNRKVDVALHNETLARERVDMLERRVDCVVDWATATVPETQILGRGFIGRLKWLFTGR